jgi:hypothetical protein
MNKKSAFTARVRLSQKAGLEMGNNGTNATVVVAILGVGKIQPRKIFGQNMSLGNKLTFS